MAAMEDVRYGSYGGAVFGTPALGSTPVNGRPKKGRPNNGGTPEEGGGDGGFEGYFSRGNNRGGEAYSPSGSNVHSVEGLLAQLTACQAKLAERTNELDAAKERTTLMEEHIESITDREDIVKANVTAIFYLACCVVAVLCCAGGAAWYYEPVGLPLANSMASRWVAACKYDEVCPSQHAPPESTRPSGPRGFLGSLLTQWSI